LTGTSALTNRDRRFHKPRLFDFSFYLVIERTGRKFLKKNPPAYPKIAIVVLNWNGLKDTLECLDSIEKIRYPDYELLVVDNGSSKAEAEALKKRCGAQIRFIGLPQNLGFAGGNNAALRWLLNNSRAAYFLLINNDIVVAPDFLNELAAAAQGDPAVALAGPKTYFYQPAQMIQSAYITLNLWKGTSRHAGSNLIDQGQMDQGRDVDCLQGSCLLLSRCAVEKVGLLDEE